MLDNAADRKSIRRKEKESRLADRARGEVIASIMSTPAGRAWIWDILEFCHLFHATFNGDALGSAFREGERNVGIRFLTDIMAHCPNQYIQAMRESNERHNSNHRDPNDPDDSVNHTSSAPERRSGPIADGGDSGAESDRDEDSDDIGNEVGWQTVGADIYNEGPKGR